MSDRIKKFFEKNITEAWSQTKDYYKQNPTRGKIIIAAGVLGMMVDPQAPIGVPAAFASIEADKRRHEKTIEDMRAAHARGESLEKYKMKLENFAPDRIKETYTAGDKPTRDTRFKRTATWLGGGLVEVLATGGVGAAISAGYAASRARERDKLARELEAQSGPKI